MADDSRAIKYFIYARKSTESEDRQVLSLASQIDALEEIAKRDGLHVVGKMSESKSAKQPGREVYGDMINKIKQDKAQGILCWKLDRLARNPIDGGEIAWLIQQGIIKHIKTPSKDYFPTDNVMLMSVEFGMANQFIIDLKANTKRGLMAKVKSGWCPCVSKPGYMGDRFSSKGEKKIMSDPERFPLLEKAFDLMLSGTCSPPQILEKLNNEWGYRTPIKKRVGGKPLSKSSIYRILTDPFYYGKFEYPMGSGNWYDGKHETMITEGEYWRIQELLGRKGKPRPKKHKFAFTGQIRCGECGSMITAEEKFKINKGNGLIHHYTYYRCTKKKLSSCSQKTISVHELEKQIDEHLQRVSIPEDFKDWAVKWLKEINGKEIEDRTVVYKSQQAAYNDAQRQLDNLTQMRLRELLTDEEYLQQKDKLLKQRERFAERLRDTEQRADSWCDQVEKTFEFSCHARHWFMNGDLIAKKAILASLGSDFTLKDRKLNINLQKPFEIMEKGFADMRLKQVWLEPATIGLFDKKNTSPARGDVFWGGIRESNP
ncbi:MAG: recombinase family protein [Candidatus Buchananbacteria bacterium]|nr:recombinase family protein [Candidatus Buchananbacteria bacterium]